MANLSGRRSDDIHYKGDLGDFDNVWSDEPYFIPTVTVYGLTFVVGVLGNALVIFAILGDRKNRGMTATLMVSLAVADLLFLSVCVPYETSRYFLGNWAGGQVLCKLSGFVEMLSAVATTTNLTAIGGERYIVIVHPMKSRHLCTRGRIVITVVAVWILATFISLPNFFIMGTDTIYMSNNNTRRVIVLCSENGITSDNHVYFALYQLSVMLVAPTIIMCFCYIRVIYTLWLSTKHLTSMTETPTRVQTFRLAPQSTMDHRASCKDQTSEAIESRKQVIKMLVTVIVVFVLCWGPKLTFVVMRRLQLEIIFYQSAHTAKIIVDCLPYVQSCLNPIIYGFMSQNFRRSMRYACLVHVKRRIHNCCCGRCKQRDSYNFEVVKRPVSRSEYSNGSRSNVPRVLRKTTATDYV